MAQSQPPRDVACVAPHVADARGNRIRRNGYPSSQMAEASLQRVWRTGTPTVPLGRMLSDSSPSGFIHRAQTFDPAASASFTRHGAMRRPPYGTVSSTCA